MAPSPGPTDLSGAAWRKSTWSSPEGQNCIEVTANLPGIIAIRDSTHPAAQPLIITHRNWSAFTRAIRAGRYP